MGYRRLSDCLACGRDSLIPYLDLGNQPLANSYTEVRKQYLPKYELAANFCGTCTHSQLTIAVDPEDMFQDYKYVTGTSNTLNKHMRGLAEVSVKKWKELTGYNNLAPIVFDIGSNDGTLLKYFYDQNCWVHGIDPAENLAAISKANGVNTLVAYWGRNAVRDLKKLFPSGADIITACNVFAHNLDPHEFLLSCGEALHSDGLLIIEFPLGTNTFGGNQFDQYYHEHVNYFTVKSFRRLAERSGFKVIQMDRQEVHGGTMRFFLQQGSPTGGQYIASNETIEECYAFTNRCLDNVSKLRAYLERAKDHNYKVIAYGASAKSSTLFNWKELDIDYVVDDNPLKVGLYCPGSGFPIGPTRTIEDEQGACIFLLTAWNFEREIVSNIKALRGEGRGDKVVTYIPEFKVTNL